MPSTRRKLCSIGDPVNISTDRCGIRECKCSQIASMRRILPSPKVSCEYTSNLAELGSSNLFSTSVLEALVAVAITLHPVYRPNGLIKALGIAQTLRQG